MNDYGICLTADCSGGAQTERVVTIGSDWTTKVYLKVPERYSGNNFQVLIQKTDYSGNPLPETKIAATSPIFTTWKRVYVERDKMFRRGGLLYEDFNKSACGSNCNQIRLYDWANVHKDDVIVVFDELSPYETKGEVKTVSTEPVNNGDGTITVTLDSNLTANCYYASTFTGDPPMPDFANGHSGGVGVLLSADFEIHDTSSNQINGPGSAFYDADMRAIEKTYNDAYVQFLGLRDGMSAVPYLPPSFFDGFNVGADCTTGEAKPGYNFNSWFKFGWIWFKNHGAPNYIWLGGIGTTAPLDAVNCKICGGSNPAPQIWGLTLQSATESFVFVGAIEAYCASQNQTANAVKGTTNHEAGHLFYVNPLDSSGHDERCQWIYDDTLSCSTTPIPACSVPASGCLMNPQRERWNTEHRFDIWDLFCGWGDSCLGTSPPGCCENCDVPGDGAIRHFTDNFEGVMP